MCILRAGSPTFAHHSRINNFKIDPHLKTHLKITQQICCFHTEKSGMGSQQNQTTSSLMLSHPRELLEVRKVHAYGIKEGYTKNM